MQAHALRLLVAGALMVGCAPSIDVIARPASLVDMHGLANRSAPVLTMNWPAVVPTYDDGTFVIATAQPDGSATALWETTGSVRDVLDRYDRSLTTRGFAREGEELVADHLVRDYRGLRHRVTVIGTRSGERTSLAVTVGAYK